MRRICCTEPPDDGCFAVRILRLCPRQSTSKVVRESVIPCVGHYIEQFWYAVGRSQKQLCYGQQVSKKRTAGICQDLADSLDYLGIKTTVALRLMVLVALEIL